MKIIKKFKSKIRKFFNYGVKFKNSLLNRVFPSRYKEMNELNFWKNRKEEEGDLNHDHYKYFYTTHFGLSESFYQNKILLDIGCGPRGSLEWATMAKRRIGIDPLVNEYLKLGADKHQMEYINAPSENIPLPNNSCDAVFSFNSLDHVDNIEKTINEIKKVLKVGGVFLLIVEVNHSPTTCEPHNLNPMTIINYFTPYFKIDKLNVYKPEINDGVYQSILENKIFSDPETTLEVGYLTAMFIKV